MAEPDRTDRERELPPDAPTVTMAAPALATVDCMSTQAGASAWTGRVADGVIDPRAPRDAVNPNRMLNTPPMAAPVPLCLLITAPPTAPATPPITAPFALLLHPFFSAGAVVVVVVVEVVVSLPVDAVLPPPPFEVAG